MQSITHKIYRIKQNKVMGGPMTFSLILLGVLLILVFFNVGESIYSKLRIKKGVLIFLLISTIVFYFIPKLNIKGVNISWVGFVFPLIFSLIILFKTKNKNDYFKMFVATLIAFALSIIYDLITFDVYESAILQPYLVLALILGSFGLVLTKTPTKLYASNFVGVILAEIVFYLSRYSIYGEYYLTLGGEKVFCVLLTSFVFSMLTYFVARKAKANFVHYKLRRNEKSGF